MSDAIDGKPCSKLPMSDMERYVQLLESFGFELKIPVNNDPIFVDNGKYFISNNTVYLGWGAGYVRCQPWMSFDKDGKFLSYGAAE